MLSARNDLEVHLDRNPAISVPGKFQQRLDGLRCRDVLLQPVDEYAHGLILSRCSSPEARVIITRQAGVAQW